MIFNQDLENCLLSLRSAQLIGIPTHAGWMLAASAPSEKAVKLLMNCAAISGIAAGEPEMPVILLADERDLLQYTAAPDLAIYDWLEQSEPTVAFWLDNVLGIPECMLTPSGSGLFSFVRDEFCFHLIKRLQQPLAVIPIGQERLKDMGVYIAGAHTTFLREGYEIKSFGYLPV